MSFSFFKQSRSRTPQELARVLKDSLLALDSKTVAEVKALEKALEEVEKKIATIRGMLLGDGGIEPSVDVISQLTVEICSEDLILLLFHKLPILGWEEKYCPLLVYFAKAKVDSMYYCAHYLEKHLELLNFLVVRYDNKEIALTCGHMLRDCIRSPTLAKIFLLNIQLQFLNAHYKEFFEPYEKLLASTNYVTRRQSLKLLSDFILESSNSSIMKRYTSEVRHLKVMMTLLKDSSKNIQISAFHIFKVFVANPNKQRDIKVILAKNHERLLELLTNLSPGKGAEDDQFEEEKE